MFKFRDKVFTIPRAPVDRLSRFIVRRNGAVLTVTLIFTAVCLALASEIRLDANMTALLPEDTPDVQNLKRVLAKTKGAGDLMIMIESPDQEQSIAYAKELLPDLKELPWVERAEIGKDTTFYDTYKLLYMDISDLQEVLNRVQEKIRDEKLRRNPLYLDLSGNPPKELSFKDIEDKYKDKNKDVGRRYYQNKDGTILVLVIHPKGITSDIPFSRRIYREVQQLTAAYNPHDFHPKMKVSVGGTFKNRLDEYDTIISDVCTGALWVGLGIVLLLVLYFRHPAAIPVILIPLAVSMAVTFAVAAFVIGTLNIITVFLFLVLLGLGIDFGIHMFARYRKERGAGKCVEEALSLTLRYTGRASLVAALTTAAAFFVLMFAEFRGFSEFGFIAGTGLVFSSAAFLTVFPAIVVRAERRFSLCPGPRRGEKPKKLLPFLQPQNVLIASILFSVVSLSLIKDTSFEYDFRQIRSDVHATRKFNKKMRQVFARPRDPSAVLVEGPREAAAVATALEQRIKANGEAGMIREVLTLHDLIPKDQPQKLGIIKELKHLLDNHEDIVSEQNKEQIKDLKKMLDAGPVTVEVLPEYLKRPFLGPEGDKGELVFIFQKRSLLDVRNAAAFSKEVRDIKADGKTYQAAGEPLVYAAMFQSLKREAPWASVAITVVIFLTVLMDVRSMHRTFIVLLPLAVGVLWMFGAMAFFGVRFNLLNAVVLPCVLGLGVDGGVHLYHCFENTPADRRKEALRHMGISIIACIATSMIGFGGMIAAEHPGLRSIGVAAIFGLGANLLSSVFFFPAFLTVRLPRLRNGASQRSS